MSNLKSTESTGTTQPTITKTTKTTNTTQTINKEPAADKNDKSENPDVFLPDQFAKERKGERGRRAYRQYVEMENTNRQAFKGIESLLSSLGQAVGLGNIWRFPQKAYQNGGSSFLIPYLVCAFVFAIPAIHMEFVLGQYAAKSPPAVFRRIMPVLEGIGWMCCLVGAIIGIYYMILISWIGIYLANSANAVKMSKCDNEWNNQGRSTCYEGMKQKLCKGANMVFNNDSRALNEDKHPEWMYFDGKCQNATGRNMASGTEQFFTNFVINPSTGFTDFNSINWATLGAVAVCWILTSIILIRGMKMIGKLSYFTVILPYVIIVILMIRGITLDGASAGLYFLWAKSDFSSLWSLKAWVGAMTQICFSLSIGQGGLMNIASYNKKSYNWYRDAYLLVLCDTMMSLLGGTAVFATLGFLAKQRQIEVPAVIKEGHALAFIVYTEAISQMPMPYLWHALFFLMLFLLGMSTEIVIVEIVCSCLTDRFGYLRRHRWLTVLMVSLTFFSLGLVMTSDAGYYWFDLYDEYSAGVSATLGTAFMCITVSFCYGLENFRKDMTELWGEPQSRLAKWFGPASYVWVGMWIVITPLCSIGVMVVFVVNRRYPYEGDGVKYPPIFDVIGWFVTSIPFLAIPCFAIYTILKFRNDKIPLRGAFMIQKQHPAFDRVTKNWPEWKKVIGDQLPDQEPGDDDVEFVDGDEEEQEESLIE
ncbi:hypothetical protein L3Y34_000292 [Caenorhabditis briggsae]|uniref:Uncharacterized protein n=1 Tax=Caenorhabditis briggsae TaxID=6238 RepID=A0AAE9D931_CAEBR|nr:hypothetical protein L3Y34_000292 [Caenorhabditis briggsae]